MYAAENKGHGILLLEPKLMQCDEATSCFFIYSLSLTVSLFLLMLLMMLNDDRMKHHEQCSASLRIEGMPRHGY